MSGVIASLTTLELGCKKSVRSGYVLVLGFTKCKGVRLLARFLIYLRMLTEVVLGCLKSLRGGLGLSTLKAGLNLLSVTRKDARILQ